MSSTPLRFAPSVVAFAIVCAALTGTAAAQPPAGSWPGAGGMPPGMAGIPAGAPGLPAAPSIPKVALTSSTARQAVDAFLKIRNKYADVKPPSTKPGAAVDGMLASQDISGIVNSYGFENPETWHGTLMNVVVAYGMLKDGDDQIAKFDEQIEKMKKADLPPQYRDQMMASIAAMRPSDGNLAVMKELMADPVYSAKLRDIESN